VFSSIFDASGSDGLRLVLALGLISMVVTVGLLLQVLALRARSRQLQAQQARVVARWRPLLLRAAAGDEVQPATLRRNERDPLLLLWNQMQDGLRGSAHEGLNRFADALDLPALARRAALHGSGSRRVLGLHTLGHLRDPADWDILAGLLPEPRSFVSLAAARALLQIDARRAAPLVLDEYLARTDWPVPRLGTLLREAGADAIGLALSDRLLDRPPAQQVRLLPLARVTEAPGRGSVIEGVLARATDAGVLAVSLLQVHGPGSLRRVRELCSHDDWHVRSYAALALGRLGGAPERARLVGMLADRQWWVRYRAAQALLGLPGFDEVAVRALAAGLTDRYARDMLHQVLAEREYVS
jgi:HEAT repeat protein